MEIPGTLRGIFVEKKLHLIRSETSCFFQKEIVHRLVERRIPQFGSEEKKPFGTGEREGLEGLETAEVYGATFERKLNGSTLCGFKARKSCTFEAAERVFAWMDGTLGLVDFG
jgi:hypothetical protein